MHLDLIARVHSYTKPATRRAAILEGVRLESEEGQGEVSIEASKFGGIENRGDVRDGRKYVNNGRQEHSIATVE